MRLLPRPKDHLSRRGRVVAWVGALLAILIIATLAVAVLMPVFAAAQLLSPSQASRRSGEPSALALIGVGVTLTGMDVGDTRRKSGWAGGIAGTATFMLSNDARFISGEGDRGQWRIPDGAMPDALHQPITPTWRIVHFIPGPISNPRAVNHKR